MANTRENSTFIQLKKLLEKSPLQFSDQEKIQFIKYYVYDHLLKLNQKYKGICYNDDFSLLFNKTSEKLLAAENVGMINECIEVLIQFACSWNSKYFLEKSLKSIFSEYAETLAVCSRIIHHYEMIFKYGILPRFDLPSKHFATSGGHSFYATGFPKDLMQKLIEDPHFCIVYVSGADFNPYGHALLFLGNAGFIHVDTVLSLPKHLTIAQFNQYLIKEKKFILGFQTVPLTGINNAIIALNNSIQKQWLWLAVKHNCLTFCFEMLKAGGYSCDNDYDFQLVLPKNYLTSTKDQHLFPNVNVSLAHQRQCFSIETLKTEYIRNMLIMESYSPQDIMKFTLYVIEHFDDVLSWQVDVILENKHVANNSSLSDINDFEEILESPKTGARRMILQKLQNIIKSMLGEHAALFADVLTVENKKQLVEFHDIIEELFKQELKQYNV